jgi:hypothetical protein
MIPVTEANMPGLKAGSCLINYMLIYQGQSLALSGT